MTGGYDARPMPAGPPITDEATGRIASAQDPPEPVLAVDELSRSFGSRQVIKSLDLLVDPGERVGLRGVNGSGKSTALRCMAGTLAPSSGSVRIGGHRAGSMPARRLLGVSLSQERSFYLRLSGRENLRMFARLGGASRQEAREDVAAVVEELEVEAIVARPVMHCSTGMVQQLAFARSLLGRPSLLLLDEPTRSLDEGAVARVWAAIERRTHVSVVIATHRPDDLARCTRVVEFPV